MIMPSWNPLSLRLQMLASISLVLVASLSVGAVLTYLHAISKVETEMRAAIVAGESSALRAVDALSGSVAPHRELRLIVSGFDGNRHLRATVVDHAGRVFDASEVSRPSEPAPEWIRWLLTRPALTATIPLPDSLRDQAAIRIETDDHNEIGEVWEDLTLKLMLMTLFCGLVLVLVYLTLGRVLAPLRGLSDAFGRVGAGLYGSKVAEDGPSELATIYRGFNRMVEKLSEMELQNQRLSDQLLTVQEEERADIARDLHDEIGPFLFAVDVDATTIHRSAEQRGQRQELERADAIRESVAHMQKHLRSILGRLKPASLVDLGLSHAVDHLVGFWRGRNRSITFDVSIPADSYGVRLDAVCYRIVQESLSNAIRHGRPTRIGIRAEETDDGWLNLSVSDDGGGLKSFGQNGFGLVGMRERVAALGGQVHVEDRPGGGGVIVHAELPLRDDKAIDLAGKAAAARALEATIQ